MPVTEQQRTLAAAGVEVSGAHAPVYIDRLHAAGRKAKRLEVGDLVERERCIADVRSGARLVVASLDRIGLSHADIADAVARVIAKGATVYDTSTQMELGPITASPDVLTAVAAAAKALTGQRIAPAREMLTKRRNAGTIRTGPISKVDQLPAEKREELRRDWLEHLQMSQSDLEKKWGMARNTMRKAFGDRAAPRGRRAKRIKQQGE